MIVESFDYLMKRTRHQRQNIKVKWKTDLVICRIIDMALTDAYSFG